MTGPAPDRAHLAEAWVGPLGHAFCLACAPGRVPADPILGRWDRVGAASIGVDEHGRPLPCDGCGERFEP